MSGIQHSPRLSAIAILVPELEPLVGEWRAKHDTSAAQGVGAHVTLLAPFLPVELITEQVVVELRAFFSEQPMPALEFSGVCGFRNAIYLPPEPQEAVSVVIKSLAARYPETPPYGGTIPVERVIPHVSVAFSDDAEELAAIATAFCRVSAGHLPVRVQVREALLVVQNDAGIYQTFAILPFKSRA